MTATSSPAVTVSETPRSAWTALGLVATSAHPDAVMKLFGHTIPTGLQHGTVTVVIGRGKARAFKTASVQALVTRKLR